MKTSAASGSLSTQNFEQIFDAKAGTVEIKMQLILPILETSVLENIQLHLEIQRNEIICGSETNESFAIQDKDQLYQPVSHVIIYASQLVWRMNGNFDSFYTTSLDYKLFLSNRGSPQPNSSLAFSFQFKLLKILKVMYKLRFFNV